MRALSRLFGVQQLDPPPSRAQIRRGVPVELRWAQETVWVGVMDVDLPALAIVPDVMRRASAECFPQSPYGWWPLRNRTHPNDFTGYPATPGDPDTWIIVMDVGKVYH